MAPKRTASLLQKNKIQIKVPEVLEEEVGFVSLTLNFEVKFNKIKYKYFQDIVLKNVQISEEDSSDSEDEQVYTSDDEGELSFESDDDGNFSSREKTLTTTENDDDDDEADDDYDDELDDDDYDDAEESDNKAITDRVTKKLSQPNHHRSNVKVIKANAVEALSAELNATIPIGKNSSGNSDDDEYREDTSDEEDIRNTVGNIPMHWYDEYKHIGYDWDAKKIIKAPHRDQLDDFLKRMEDPNFWRTVKDAQTGQDIIISDADIELLKRINSQRIPDSSYDDFSVSLFSFFFS